MPVPSGNRSFTCGGYRTIAEFAIHNRQRKAEVTRVEDVVTLAGTNSNVVFLDFRRADEIVNLFCCNHAGDSAFIAQPVGVNA